MPKPVSQNFLSKSRKAVRILASMAFNGLLPWVVEYGLCYAFTVVISDTLLHGKLDQPMATFGLLAIGVFCRYFVQRRPQVNATLSQPGALPVDLAVLLNQESRDAYTRDGAGDFKAGPYL